MRIGALLSGAALMVCASTALAGARDGDDIVRWVDESGEIQFTNRQFAPVEHTVVRLAPTNGAQLPKIRLRENATRGGSRTVKLGKYRKQNKRGWRGHRRHGRRSSR